MCHLQQLTRGVHNLTTTVKFIEIKNRKSKLFTINTSEMKLVKET